MYLMAYLLVFRYHELGYDKIRKLFNAAGIAPRIAEYVEFLLNDKAVRSSAVPLWLHSYDREFLEESVLAPLQEIAPEATVEVVEWFQNKGLPQVAQPIVSEENPTRDVKKRKEKNKPPSAAEEGTRRTKLPPYEVREMAFTIPEPRPPPVKNTPEGANGVARAPKKPPTEPVGFSFHAREKKRKSVEEFTKDLQDMADSSKLNRRNSKELRKILEKNVDVRNTNATLMREAYINEKQMEEERKKLENKEFTLGDDADYEEWRRQQQEKEDEMRRVAVMERNLDALERTEHTREMKQAQENKKREENRKEREAAEKEAKRRQRSEAAQKAKQKGYVQKFRSNLQSGRAAAAESVAAEKSKSANEVRKENEKLALQKREAEEEEKNDRALLIAEIRLLRGRIKAQKETRMGASGADRRSSAVSSSEDGFGAMNKEDLQRELKAIRGNNAKEEEERRRAILSEKEKEREERSRLEENLLAERQRRRQQREQQQQQKKTEEKTQRASRTAKENARMLELHEKLESKRNAKRDAMRQQREKEKKNKYELLLRSKDIVALEQNRWKQLEEGAINRVVANQNKRLN
ncbi:hypothetical protein, conserved [Angomonas deanei]|uniref:Uncharacterized protein n=1 Tax=Angomonas deanei TaxID=59799 RepID=A0A7G2C9J4_9TRYP|nr:hypothetical protein, conserved [Angomonas deanei]